VGRHITAIFAKLGLSSNSAHHRRVRATLHYLNGHKPDVKVAPARIASKQLFKRELVHNG
jgi:hypothetical protein